MEVNIFTYQTKINLLLQKLLVNSNVKIDANLNKFLTHLWQQEQTDIESTVIIFPIFTEWLKQAISLWNSTNQTPQLNLATFTLNLAAIISKNENRFDGLNNNNFFIKLIRVLKVKQIDNTNVKLAYIKLLSSFLEHSSGIEWMMACNFWEDIFQLSLTNLNEELVQESTKFMSKLLEKTIEIDENFCNNVVKRIMLPLGENIYKSIKTANDISEVTQDVASEFLKPTLKLMGNILEYFLKGIYFDEKDFQVLIIFLKNFHLEERISDFMIIAQTKCLVFELCRIMLIMQFLELYVKVATNTLSLVNINNSVKKLKHNFILHLCKVSFEECVEFCNFGLIFWNVVHSKLPYIPEKKDNSLITFSDQLTVLEMLSPFCIMIKFCWDKVTLEKLLLDEFRDLFIQKLFETMCHDVIRACYAWRDNLVLRDDLFELTIWSNNKLKETKLFLTQRKAVIVVQTFIYVLKDFVDSIKETPSKLEPFLNQISYFAQVLDILVSFIEDFSITWKDTLESIDLLSIVLDFLVIYSWPSTIIVLVLKLIRVATEKYMAPNLALLLDSSSDSTVVMLGPLLFSKLYHENGEVKCAALEVIRTMATISSNKFPSLQKVLMDSELPTLVVKMSANDSESFVRATAIKCLQEMIQVEEIWNNALKSEDLTQKMRQILINETEGIVRVEAATFMCVAYEHQQFPKNTLEEIYETMIYSSTTDLHWEVKVRALEFWDKVIKNHLQNQGMIDGTFPNVTFSKEHRKIVTLTDSEIRKRLLKVLNQLSSIGCLGVLTSAIKDDCDMEVAKTAVKITQRLVDLFKKYNVRSNYSTPTSPTPTENCMSATVSLSSGISVDEFMDSPSSTQPDFNEDIIEQIVNTKDVNLLRNVYSPSDYGSVSNYDIQVRKIINPNEFLQFTQQDLNNVITEKKKWLNGIEDLGSLLDDMLKTYDDDVNNMDCY